jgi:hypothetical protein
MKVDQIDFPRPSDEGRMTSFDWMPIRYRDRGSQEPPFTPGFTCTEKSEKRISIVEGRARRTTGMANQPEHGG